MNNRTKIAIGVTVVALAAAAVGVARSRPNGSAIGSGDVQAMPDMPGMDGQPRTDAMDGGEMQGMAGMDMGSDGSVRVSPGDVATFGITFGTVEVRPLTRIVRAAGFVEFDETRMAYVAPKFAGWAERLHVDFTGDVVRAGQPLLDVYAPELVAAQEELLLAARMRETARASRVEEVSGAADELYAASRRRLEYWDISGEQVEQLLASGEPSRTLTLHAPVSGVVMEKNVLRGQAFESGSSLYLIADLSEVWVNAEIFAQDAPVVREGMPAEVTVEGLPGRTLTGLIEYVYPTVRDRSRSMRARISLENPRAQLKPGMYATVRLAAELGELLTVPTSAVLQTGERAVTFVDMGDGSLMPQEVELGLRGADLVQVISGLEPGQRVVTSAQYLLDSESNLAEVMRAMMAQMNLSDMGAMDMDGMDTGGTDMSPPGGR
jgi:RND family efflux transporter MFP subunit